MKLAQHNSIILGPSRLPAKIAQFLEGRLVSLKNFLGELLNLQLDQVWVISLLGSYNNRIYNFELAMVSLVILYIILLSAKLFSIIKNKKCKEGIS